MSRGSGSGRRHDSPLTPYLGRRLRLAEQHPDRDVEDPEQANVFRILWPQ
jgi:hypothetical protein